MERVRRGENGVLRRLAAGAGRRRQSEHGQRRRLDLEALAHAFQIVSDTCALSIGGERSNGFREVDCRAAANGQNEIARARVVPQQVADDPIDIRDLGLARDSGQRDHVDSRLPQRRGDLVEDTLTFEGPRAGDQERALPERPRDVPHFRPSTPAENEQRVGEEIEP